MLILLYFISVLFIFYLDFFSKQCIVHNLALGERITIIDKFFSITYVQNDGAGFSILKGQQWLFYIITPIAIGIFVYLLLKSKKKDILTKVCCLFIIGGALGNLYDRITKGYVIDFLDFVIFGYDFPVFNIADSFLTVGVFLYLIITLLEEKHASN